MSAPTLRAGERVDLLLVLAADVSHSIAGGQFKLQREGYAQAITIRWSDEIFQTVVADWTLIRDVGDTNRFANRIMEVPRSTAENTSISTAILFAAAQIERAPFRSERRVIDHPEMATTLRAATSHRHGTKWSVRALR